jgi:hypothetical protein
LDQSLRRGDTAIVGRIERDRLMLDLRSIPCSLDADFRSALLGTLSGGLA